MPKCPPRPVGGSADVPNRHTCFRTWFILADLCQAKESGRRERSEGGLSISVERYYNEFHNLVTVVVPYQLILGLTLTAHRAGLLHFLFFCWLLGLLVLAPKGPQTKHTLSIMIDPMANLDPTAPGGGNPELDAGDGSREVFDMDAYKAK